MRKRIVLVEPHCKPRGVLVDDFEDVVDLIYDGCGLSEEQKTFSVFPMWEKNLYCVFRTNEWRDEPENVYYNDINRRYTRPHTHQATFAFIRGEGHESVDTMNDVTLEVLASLLDIDLPRGSESCRVAVHGTPEERRTVYYSEGMALRATGGTIA